MSARADSGTSRVQIRTVGRFVIVPVVVQDRGPFPFLLDTGSASTVIDVSLARELSLEMAGATTLMTSNGSAEAPLVKASLTFGAVSASNVDVVQFQLASLVDVDRSVRGVLGQDVLRRSNWLLDYRRRVIEQDIDGALRNCVEGDRIEMRWAEDRPAVTAVFGGEPPTDLVLDSASTGIVLFNVHATDGSRRLRESARLKSLSDDVQAPMVGAEAMTIGSIVVRRPKAALVTIEGAPRGGLLPTSLFDAVYFDNDSSAAIIVSR